jgi:hypothetical protein
MKVEATDAARDFIESHGGEVYVWAGADDISHASTTRPDEPVQFEKIDAGGFTLFQDVTIGEPDWWKLEFHHLPHEHITATWDSGIYSSSVEPL